MMRSLFSFILSSAFVCQLFWVNVSSAASGPLAEGFVYHGTVDPDRAIAAGQDASGPVNLFGRGGEDGQHGFDLAGMDAQLAAHPLIARSSCVARRFVRVIQRGGHPVERPGQISKT